MLLCISYLTSQNPFYVSTVIITLYGCAYEDCRTYLLQHLRLFFVSVIIILGIYFLSFRVKFCFEYIVAKSRAKRWIIRKTLWKMAEGRYERLRQWLVITDSLSLVLNWLALNAQGSASCNLIKNEYIGPILYKLSPIPYLYLFSSSSSSLSYDFFLACLMLGPNQWD